MAYFMQDQVNPAEKIRSIAGWWPSDTEKQQRLAANYGESLKTSRDWEVRAA